MTDQNIRERAYYRWLEHSDPAGHWLDAERLQDRPGLLVFLGAGASLDLGVPSTGELTTRIVPALATPDGYVGGGGQACQSALMAALTRCYDRPHFEHVQHGLEALSALVRSRRPGTVASFKVVEAELTSALDAAFPTPFDDQWLIAARTTFFKILQSTMTLADQQVSSHASGQGILNFLKRLNREFTLQVATTNYDTVTEQALGWGAEEQGFEPISGESTGRFMGGQAPAPRMMHLHGSLQFGYRESSADPNRYVYEDDHEDLYLHDSSAKALATWFGRSGLTSMAGRDTIAGPIITGLQKPDKLLVEPYLSYYHHFSQAAANTPRILIVGYGFGDQHITAILSRLTKWHGARRRVALIDYCQPQDWAPSSCWPPDRLSTYRTVAKLSEQSDALDVLSWPDPWVPTTSPGRDRLQVYFRGFAATIAKHEDRLVAFLRS